MCEFLIKLANITWISENNFITKSDVDVCFHDFERNKMIRSFRCDDVGTILVFDSYQSHLSNSWKQHRQH